jgi:hypothetical protein
MKATNILKIALLAMPLIISSCGTKKKVVEEQKPQTTVTTQENEFVQKVNSNVQSVRFITSKVKFTVEYGTQDIALTGNLRMKRDDVIRLQLMAFGFVEAARLEFTKDYVLIMDRINKQYLKAPYNQIDFLRNSGINFYTLQALFWDELFMPNRSALSDEDLKKYSTNPGGEDVVISYEDNNNKLSYSWLANEKTGIIKMANILYKDRFNGNTQLNWDYLSFTRLESNNKQFPDKMNATLTMPKKEIKLGITLNYIGHETEWETRTNVSNKYREVTVDEILRRFMSL